MELPIAICIALAVGLFIGFRIGAYHIRQENLSLHRQLILLQGFSEHWSSVSANRIDLSSKIAQDQTNNLSTNMQMVITLLKNIEQKNGQALDTEEQKKISQLIQNAKGIISP